MNICDHCGAQFEGKICPACRTMRPAAAVISESDRQGRTKDSAQEQKRKRPSTCDELKAVGWTRKAPAMRSRPEKEEDVVVTDALRSLKIASSRTKTAPTSEQPEPQKTENTSDEQKLPAEASCHKGVSEWVTGRSRVPSVPRKGAGADTASKQDNSRRIDAAWKLFAAEKKNGSE